VKQYTVEYPSDSLASCRKAFDVVSHQSDQLHSYEIRGAVL